MADLFETNRVSHLLERNFDSIRQAYEALDSEGNYEEFVRINEEIIETTSPEGLKEELEGFPVKICCESPTMARLHSLQYAQLLTRYAQEAASEGRMQMALLALAEACYYAGFGQGMGLALHQQANRPNPTLSASHAAKTQHEKQRAPLKKRLIELLEANPRQEKWKSVETAFRKFQPELENCIKEHNLRLKSENLPSRIKAWYEQDVQFKEQLSRFVTMKK